MSDCEAPFEIPEHELSFEASRSSGPGGQNVNKVESRVTLLFDLEASTSLTPEQKTLLARRLSTRINREGILRLSSQRHRTQGSNRRDVVERFHRLLAEALRERKPRRPTRVPAAIDRRRLENKRRKGRAKADRGPVREDR